LTQIKTGIACSRAVMRHDAALFDACARSAFCTLADASLCARREE